MSFWMAEHRRKNPACNWKALTAADGAVMPCAFRQLQATSSQVFPPTAEKGSGHLDPRGSQLLALGVIPTADGVRDAELKC